MDLLKAFAAGQDPPLQRPSDPGIVWIATARTEDWMPWLAQAGELLSGAEQARVSAKRRIGDRYTLVLCYALHRLLLSAWLRMAPGDVPLLRDAQGRPRVDAGGVYTSLSHADGALAFAVGTLGPVGVDVEATARADGLDDIAERIAHPTELVAMAAWDDSARRQALLRLWVRKEACLKAVGAGLAYEMDSFAAAVGARLTLAMYDSGEPLQLRVEDLQLRSPHVAAWAAPAQASGLAMVLCPGD